MSPVGSDRSRDRSIIIYAVHLFAGIKGIDLDGHYLRKWLINSSACACLLACEPAWAQIVPDATLPVNSVVTPQGNTSVIEGGTRAGGNLFHSFEEFSIPRGGEAHFNNALGIQNILSRVTGGSISNIDGLIRANGTANLFLLNPNGIIFGQGARLDIGGSFVATTAQAIQFGNQGFFNASNPEAPSPLLTVNPSALLFNQIAAASIQNNSVAPSGLDPSGTFTARGLRVSNGQSLLLVGGNVSIDGGGLFAFGGRVELGGLAGAGTVGLNKDGSNLSLNFPDGVGRSDVSLTNGASVNVRADNGGSIAINARNLEITGESSLLAGIADELGSADSKAGNIEVNAQAAVNLQDDSVINTNVRPGATGQAGDISITTGSLSLTNRARLDASTSGRGDAGSVTITAQDTVSFNGAGSNESFSGAFSSVQNGAVGKGGDISITTGSLSLTNGAVIFAATSGRGDAGNITITAQDTVSLNGVASIGTPTAAVSTVNSGGAGKGGGVSITTGSLSLTNGAQLLSLTAGQGDAGNITITARDTVSFDGMGSNGYPTAAASTVEAEGVGKGGDTSITTGSLSVTDGAQLAASTSGRGGAGNITITAQNTVSFDGVSRNGSRSAAASTVDSTEAVGKGGGISITTGSLSLTNGAILTTRTFGKGDAGSITITARDTVSFDGVTSDGRISSATSTVQPGAVGKGGEISITTGSLSLSNGTELSVNSNGKGTAGDIQVNSNSIRLDNQAGILARTASGNGGNIALGVQDLLILRRRSEISTTAGTTQAGGNGGNITINAPNGFIVAVPGENSDITANAFTGKGGNIQIKTQGIFGTQFRKDPTPESDITASSEFGVSGVVEINAPDVDPSQGIVELPSEIVDPTELIANSCIAPSSRQRGSFIITGSGGLPALPDDPSNSPFQTYTVPDSLGDAAESRPYVPWKPGNQIIEAQGMYRLEDGRIVLARECSI